MGIFPKDRDLTQAPKEVELEVRASDLRQRAETVELRLDAFLVVHLTWRSRNSIQELIRAGQVLVDPRRPIIRAGPASRRSRSVRVGACGTDRASSS
jgi:ribosomal 50S subunit-recycling heat shock protein